MSTPNMKLTLPVVQETQGPEWAQQVNNSVSKVDAHNHTSGKGVKITPAGININANLSFNGNKLIPNKVKFNNTASTSVTSVYTSSGDLYYNNAGAGVVQITDDNVVLSSVDGVSRSLVPNSISSNTTLLNTNLDSILMVDTTSSTITITLPPISSFTQGRYFVVKDASGNAGTNNITISADGSDLIDGAASILLNYNYADAILVNDGASWLTYKRPYVIPTSDIVDNTVTTTKLIDGNVTQDKLAALYSVTSSSSGAAVIDASVDTAVTNLSVTITRTGRPVVVKLIHDGSANAAQIGPEYTTSSSGTNISVINQGVNININKNNTSIWTSKIYNKPRYTNNTAPNLYGYVSSLTYGNGIFVAGGYTDIDSGTAITSDGINWTKGSSNALTTTFADIIYDGSRFVGVCTGSSGGSTISVATSTNGTSWTTAANGGVWRGVAYGNGRYIAVGHNPSNNNVIYSTSATSGWTAAVFTSPNDFQDIAYGSVGTIFAAINTSGIWTTTNGASGTWTQRLSGVSNMKAITYGNNLFVVVGTNICYTSPDGITWTSRTIPSGSYLDVCYSNNMYIATGSSGKVSVSSDGISWTDVSATDSSAYANCFSNTTGGVMILADNGAFAPETVVTSSITLPTITPNEISTIDTTTDTGSTTYTVSVSAVNGTIPTAFKYVKLIAYEL